MCSFNTEVAGTTFVCVEPEGPTGDHVHYFRNEQLINATVDLTPDRRVLHRLQTLAAILSVVGMVTITAVLAGAWFGAIK